MRYAGLLKNDFVNGAGVCVSYWAQGCPHHCAGCHNPNTWDFDGGQEVAREVLIKEILDAIAANGLRRNFSLLGGEPLCDENIEDTYEIVKAVKAKYPDITIYAWTGALYENLRAERNEKMDYVLDNIDTLIDGPFIQAKRDVSLALRGSTNQRILTKEDRARVDNSLIH